MTNESKAKPAHEIRVGNVRATLWMNQRAKGGTFYGVTFTRLYKSGDTWKRSDSFGRSELPLVKQAADLALDWITQQASMPASQSPEQKPSPEV